MFKNLKIGVRLGAGFGFVLLLMVAILIVGMNNMATTNHSTEDIVKDRYPKTVLVNDSIAKTFDNGRSTRNQVFIFSRRE